MNEELARETIANAAPVPRPDEGPPTAGRLIRAARQAQGIDLASLAAMLKLPLRKLEALENGQHEALQGPTFERALAQAACRVLKIDAKPVLALMPQVAGNTLEHVTGGLNTPFRERQGRVELGDASSLLRPVVILPALIVIAALVLFFAPAALLERLTQPVLSVFSSNAPSTTAPAGTTAAIAQPGVASGAAADAPFATAAPAPVPTGTDAVAAAPVVPVAAQAPAASAVDEVLAHSEALPTIPLQVIASADSWVEVLDAQGRSLLSRTVVAGESVGLDGAMPMHVKVGNARGTKLTLRGDNVDLAPYTRDNVARVELK